MRFFSTYEKFPHENQTRSNNLLRSKQQKKLLENSMFLYKTKIDKILKAFPTRKHYPFHSNWKDFPRK